VIAPFFTEEMVFLGAKSNPMNLHEYQGKEILAQYGVGIQRGLVATTPEEAVQAAQQLTEETGTGWHVIKAQIHAGGRGNKHGFDAIF